MIEVFALKVLLNFFSHGEDNHMVNRALKKADVHEGIFMVFQSVMNEFQDRL